MNIELRRLDMLDIQELRNLFIECHTAEVKRESVKKNLNEQTILDQLPAYWDKWIPGITKYYLSHNDDAHLMYGVFEDDRLMCILGWRSDLPVPYDKDWVVMYLKSVPDINATRTYFPMLWRAMYEKCESSGLVRIHGLYEPHRISKYDAFSRKRAPDIDDRYTYETTMFIPAGTRPEVDWVWAMLGKQTHKVDFIIRTGTKK